MITEQTIGKISPEYKIKGTAIINLKKYIQSKKSESYFYEKARAVNLTKTDLLLPSTWYSAAAFAHLQLAAAKDIGLSDKQFALDSARYIVEEDLNGIYKFFMKLSGTSLVLGKLPQMNNAYSNFTILTTLENTKGYFKAQHETPTALCEWNQNGVEGAVRSITKLCGQTLDSIEVIEKQEQVPDKPDHQIWTFEAKYS